MSRPLYRLYGLKLSYFTGKLEGYLRAKGVPYDYVEMDTATFRSCAAETGIAQMPQLECEDGSWMTDTSDIIAHFEAYWPNPRFKPGPPAVAFASLLLEDFFDEWLWRPALYYRWGFKPDAELMSGQLADGLLRDVKAPRFLRQRYIRRRQQKHFLKQDGVTPETAPLIEKFLRELLEMLETVFEDRLFLFGDRPCEADFGLFGAMFRHFSYDPTPNALLREIAPHTLNWTARLWATTPESLRDSVAAQRIPPDLGPIFALIGRQYLPYLQANMIAMAKGQDVVSWEEDGVRWEVPVNPYRARCLEVLKQHFAKLEEPAQKVIRILVGDAYAVLADTSTSEVELPARPSKKEPLDHRWRKS